MPSSIFTFQQGSESLTGGNDNSPLLGRFRAVPDAANRRDRDGARRNSLLGTWRGYGAVFGGEGEGEGAADGGDGLGKGVLSRAGRYVREVWLEPKQGPVGRVVERWWSRWWVLVGLPALLVSADARSEGR